MISTETVFVLGAGASVPYGLQTGIRLRQRICIELRPGYSPYALVELCGMTPTHINQFRKEFEGSGIDSIDAFIAFRPEYQEIGELTIAALLIPLENQKQLAQVNGHGGNGDWYQLLWNEMRTGAEAPEHILENRISFVTFNYDRSLEQYLLNAISNTFGISQNDAFRILSRIPIRHVYGSLGEYDTERGYQYGNLDQTTLVSMVKAARKSIKTVPVVRGPKDDISAKWLSNAQRVFILGFGFDSTNCARIGLQEACSNAPKGVTPRQVFASAFSLKQSEKRWSEMNSCGPGQGGLHWLDGDCLNMLREVRDQLSRLSH